MTNRACTANHRLRQCRHRGSAPGFTLLEMLIAMAIGLFILAGLIAVLTANYNSARSNDQMAELVTNGGTALNALKQDIRQAGFRGRTWGEPEVSDGWVAPARGCAGTEPGASASAFVTNLRQGVWGANNRNPFADNCIAPQQYVPGTDVLVIRYVTALATPALRADAIYLRSSFGRGEIFRADAPPGDAPNETAAADFALRIHVYHVRPYTRSPDESPRVPALVRSTLQGDGSMRSELVAAGIEQFQVRYGHLGDDTTIQYVDTLEGASSTAVPTPWDDVHALRIWLLARASTPEAGYSNRASYAMGDQAVPPANDGYHRQLFSSVVQLRN